MASDTCLYWGILHLFKLMSGHPGVANATLCGCAGRHCRICHEKCHWGETSSQLPIPQCATGFRFPACKINADFIIQSNSMLLCFFWLILLTFLKCSQCTGPRARPNARHLHSVQKHGWASPPSSWPRSQSPGELLTKRIHEVEFRRNCEMMRNAKKCYQETDA